MKAHERVKKSAHWDALPVDNSSKTAHSEGEDKTSDEIEATKCNP